VLWFASSRSRPSRAKFARGSASELAPDVASVRAPAPPLEQMNVQCKAREVVIFCPYWIVNKTEVPLRLREKAPHATSPAVCPANLGRLASPLLFSSARGTMKMAVHPSHWSKSINLESPGALVRQAPFARSLTWVAGSGSGACLPPPEAALAARVSCTDQTVIRQAMRQVRLSCRPAIASSHRHG
jgi:SHR-binding domain of vacuolar-sorting associated protein 13